jgi:hypothetical protein
MFLGYVSVETSGVKLPTPYDSYVSPDLFLLILPENISFLKNAPTAAVQHWT